MANGHKKWFIPDMYLPQPHTRTIPGHETISIMNANGVPATLHMLAFFEQDLEPIQIDNVVVGPLKSMHFRMDRLKQSYGIEIPVEVPYSIVIESDIPVVVEYARLTWIDGEATTFGILAYHED